MITRLLIGAMALTTAACTTPATEPPAPEIWACRDVVQSAAAHAYALARFRDDQRAVILLPAGKAVAEYEAETKRLRDEGARQLAVLKENDPDAGAPRPVSPDKVTGEKVANVIASADACVAGTGK